MSIHCPAAGVRTRLASPSAFRQCDRGGASDLRNVFAFPSALLGLVLALALAGPFAASAADGPAPLDVNVATAAQLEALPGIGEVKAAAILAVREDRGGFASLDELESVRGIGPSLAKRLRPLLKVDPKTRSRTRTAQK